MDRKREVIRSFLFFCIIASLASSCESTKPDFVDVEYDQKLRNAETDCKGDEILGIWVSKGDFLSKTFSGIKGKTSLLFRPNGTGISHKSTNTDKNFEEPLTWHYDGHGVWKGSTLNAVVIDGKITLQTFRLAHGALLCARSCSFSAPKFTLRENIVFVRPDNAAALDEYLKKR